MFKQKTLKFKDLNLKNLNFFTARHFGFFSCLENKTVYPVCVVEMVCFDGGNFLSGDFT